LACQDSLFVAAAAAAAVIFNAKHSRTFFGFCSKKAAILPAQPQAERYYR
jgi:hypothetical protein